MALIMATFFLASAGAGSAYLTVSEVFPMETRALAIAFFYAIGTAIGGSSGPLLFGNFIHSGDPAQVATGFLIGAGAMALGGIAELMWGVRAEGRSLEAIATPLTAAELDSAPPAVPENERAQKTSCASGSRGARRASGRARAVCAGDPAAAAAITRRDARNRGHGLAHRRSLRSRARPRDRSGGARAR
jgi:MFS family permease